MKKELIKLANHLDRIGRVKEANFIDNLLKISSENENNLREEFERELRNFVDPYETSNISFEEGLREKSGYFSKEENIIMLKEVAEELIEEFEEIIGDDTNFGGAFLDFPDMSTVDEERRSISKLEDLIGKIK